MTINLLTILGPTASGKTSLAVKLASEINGEILSADSRQVYRGMDIGTGKDLSEYRIDDRTIPYHLIDIIEPSDEFNVFEYQKKFYEIFSALQHKKTWRVLVGGTGLYIESILLGYEMPPAEPDEKTRGMLDRMTIYDLQKMLQEMTPQLHNKTDLDQKERLIRKIEIEIARKRKTSEFSGRPEIKSAVFGIAWDRSVLRERIARRLKERLESGMIEEVWSLHEKGLTWERLDSFGLEYRYIAAFLQGMMNKEDMIQKLQIAIGQFAKRQMTWFRRMEKKGIAIHWIPEGDYKLLHQHLMKLLS